MEAEVVPTRSGDSLTSRNSGFLYFFLKYMLFSLQIHLFFFIFVEVKTVGTGFHTYDYGVG